MKSEKNILSGPPFQQKWAYKSVAEYFLEKIAKHGSAPALISMQTGEQLTHSQILEKSLKLSISLKKLGLEVNDRIGICSENNLNFGIAVFSSIFLGTTICPFNPVYTERELIYTMTISKPKYIFVSISCLAKMQKIMKNLSWSINLILLYPDASNSDIPNLSDLISKTSDFEMKNFKLPEIDKDDHVLLIACSSGTTGLPKGVMLTDKNILAQLRHYNETPGFLNENASTLGMLPFFHAYGFFILFFVMSFGAKLIVFSKFDERLFLEAVEKYRIDSLSLVPPLMVFLAKSPIVDNYDLSGDVGYYDEDGYFFIVDRLKELIKYKGFQVPPAELEAILLTHPKIRDAAVVGKPDEISGELPLAFVVKQHDPKRRSVQG